MPAIVRIFQSCVVSEFNIHRVPFLPQDTLRQGAVRRVRMHGALARTHLHARKVCAVCARACLSCAHGIIAMHLPTCTCTALHRVVRGPPSAMWPTASSGRQLRKGSAAAQLCRAGTLQKSSQVAPRYLCGWYSSRGPGPARHDQGPGEPKCCAALQTDKPLFEATIMLVSRELQATPLRGCQTFGPSGRRVPCRPCAGATVLASKPCPMETFPLGKDFFSRLHTSLCRHHAIVSR